MAYSQCVLNGYVYAVNPVESPNPPVRAVAVTETLTGRVFTDWGADASRRDITQIWPVMDATMYASLSTQFAVGGPLSFVDDDGAHYTVLFESLTWKNKTAGGDGYIDVKLLLRVISSP